jgi:hypothetical protein
MYDVVVQAYVLMGNHYHLLLTTRRANLSRFMQRLNTAYSLYARYKHSAPGHQLAGRYKAKLVQDEVYLLRVSRYVHLNPVKTARARKLETAEKRKMLREYPWSSYRAYAGLVKGEEFVSYGLLDCMGRKGLRRCQAAYRRYVESFIEDEDTKISGLMGESGYAVGDEEFLEEVKWDLTERRMSGAGSRDVAYPATGIGMGLIEKVVAEHYGIERSDLRAHGRKAGEAKRMAMELGCRLGGLKQMEVGDHYGISAMAVSMARKKLREAKPSTDGRVQDMMSIVVREAKLIDL